MEVPLGAILDDGQKTGRLALDADLDGEIPPDQLGPR
jgi:hypothetical protein